MTVCQDLCLLKPYNCKSLVKKIRNKTDFQTTEATTKDIGNTNWCQCRLCQPMEHHFCRTPPDACFCTKIFYAGLKRSLWNSCISLNFAKFLRTQFLKNASKNGTASSFSMFLGFVPINSVWKSGLKQDGSKFSEHIDSISGMNVLFRLCNYFFLIFSFFEYFSEIIIRE